jgi:thiol-disulfide isomerase/thioredoxin
MKRVAWPMLALLAFTASCKTLPRNATVRHDTTSVVFDDPIDPTMVPEEVHETIPPALAPVIMQAAGPTVKWLESQRLMPVLERAQLARKIVMIDFTAEWCTPCKVMDEEVFALPEVYNYLNEHFICLKMDYDSEGGKNICALYEVKSLPTILFLNPQGVELSRHTGMATPSKLKALGDEVLALYKR